MIGLRIGTNDDQNLAPSSQVLAPLGRYLDNCWWYLGGLGAQLAPPLPTGDESGAVEHDRLDAWHRVCQAAQDEYSLWVDHDETYRVALPGWYGRYADRVLGGWSIVCASDDSCGSLPGNSMRQVDAIAKAGWDFSKLDLPADICAVCRCVDGAYWELYFRDQWMVQSVETHLRTTPKLGTPCAIE